MIGASSASSSTARAVPAARQLVGRSLRPDDLHGTFDQLGGDFWYFALYVLSKLRRGEAWTARLVYGSEVLSPLVRMLRIEADAVDDWRALRDAFQIEHTLPAERLARLDACVPPPGAAGVEQALRAAAALGREVCGMIGARHSWPWPEALAEQVVRLLSQPADG